MSEHLLVGLASIIVLGIIAQWLGWRLRLPSILLLLVFGIIAGPISGVLHPDELFGDLLFPLVSVSVAIVLFEGGLNLRISELKGAGRVVRNLTTVGVFVTWVLTSIIAHAVVGIQWGPAILLGAILVVSGPTVIIPLLRQVRPIGSVGSIVKWEGIVNDPIGAILAVLVFEVILVGGFGEGTSLALAGVFKAVIFGGALGLLGAAAMVLLLKRYLIPDFLQNPVSLMVVVMVYAASNALQPESGLLAVTVMGIALANQKFVSIKQITEFKENLRVLLISSLFIILAARLPVEQFAFSNIENWVFVGLLIVVVRPIMVFASTFRSNLKWNERAFLFWMAPRGIVAAAVSSVFAIRLTESGYAHCEILVPLVFQVIIGTVAIYGLTAPYVARWLKVARPNPQGVLFAGAHSWAREIAEILHNEKFPVVLIDTNWQNVTAARSSGLSAYYANVLSEDLLYDIRLDGIGRLLALTPNDEVNSLAALHFVDIFGRSGVYQLAPVTKSINGKHAMPMHLRGRYLFSSEATFDYVVNRFRAGAIVKKTPLTDEFDFEAFKRMYGGSAVPLMTITESRTLRIYTAESKPAPEPGETLISIIDPVDESSE
ncbi:MAG: sodium:proton antiporter [Candidatus Zixiibacteriota bacterium]|nr:MAG: sodium:proton antiporter [candidate division Zixibacteria bacterium]